MRLDMDTSAGCGFKSASQITRRITESWGESNLYCVACDSPRLERSLPNSRARDFTCRACDARFELKAGRTWNESRIPDAGYDAMIAAVRSDCVPNLLILQYDTAWRVANLMLIPSFFFTESAVERRRPLGSAARRAGWVGCNILLRAIPAQGRPRIVEHAVANDPTTVRQRFAALRPLSQLPVQLRGWALDVWSVVNQLHRSFTLPDVYAFDGALAELHPENRHVRAKIRQQLQVLRDLGVLAFIGRGRYERVF